MQFYHASIKRWTRRKRGKNRYSNRWSWYHCVGIWFVLFGKRSLSEKIFLQQVLMVSGVLERFGLGDLQNFRENLSLIILTLIAFQLSVAWVKKKSETNWQPKFWKKIKTHKRLETNVFFSLFFLIKQDKTMCEFSRNFLFIRQTNIQTLQLMVD